MTDFLPKQDDVRMRTWQIVNALKVCAYILLLCPFDIVVEQLKVHRKFAAINLPANCYCSRHQFCVNRQSTVVSTRSFREGHGGFLHRLSFHYEGAISFCTHVRNCAASVF